MPSELPHLWPWRTRWTAVLAQAAMGEESGGHILGPTDTGAVMRVRSGMLGLSTIDYNTAGGGAAAVQAISAIWRGAGGEQAIKHGRSVHARLEYMRGEIVSTGGRPSEFDNAVSRVPCEHSAAHADQGRGHSKRREMEAGAGGPVISGALPAPTAAEMWATAARSKSTQRGGDEDDEPAAEEGESGRRQATRRVAWAARRASREVVKSAAAWRKWKDVK